MDTRNPTRLQTARETVRRLRCWQAEPAPPGFAVHVLARAGLVDAYSVVETPIGPVFVAYNDQGISLVLQAPDAQAFEAQFQARFGRLPRYAPALPPSLEEGVRQLLEGRQAPVQFDLRGLTPFEQAVLQKAREIPRGEVRPYAWIAREIGHPQAVRAVGTALGHNPVPLLIPCHRVVRSDGQIGNYRLGAEKKRTILDAEGAAPPVLERLGRSGVRFLADTKDGTFCLPTCGGMHLRNDPRLIPMHSASEALKSGFRPCHTCRPVALA